MFSGTTFNKDISGWNVDNVSTMKKKNKINSQISWLAKVKICK
nr:hypothetical protein [Mycoplasmopsis bovis]